MLERIPRREWYNLIIAWLAISIAFALAFTGGLRLLPAEFLIFLFIALVTAGIAFALHEMAHKFTAIRFGYWAEFQKNNLMLLVAVVVAALVGIVFAAPGATMVFGNPTRKENGLISAAGPLTNLILCLPFAALFILADRGTFIWSVGMVGLQVNGMIAAFNMLPFGVLDGRKVLAWNVGIFIVVIAVSFAVVALTLLSFSPGII